MLKPGLRPIKPDRRDYSFIPTFGATTFDVKGLPKQFSLYDGRQIPDQNQPDMRFTPPLPPLHYGCTGESISMYSGIQDNNLYSPLFNYENTYPYVHTTGRDMRKVIQHAIDVGLMDDKGEVGNHRAEYFHVYGSSKIDDFDAARIALWINQAEKRSVMIGTWFYWNDTQNSGILPAPTFNTKEGTLHAYLVTGWKTIDGIPHLEAIPWLGHWFGDNGRCYISRPIYNALMAQPWTAAFTITKLKGRAPIPVGMRAHVDHIVYRLHQFIRNLFHV